MNEELLTIDEVIEKYGYSKSYWYKKTGAKEVNHYKIGKQVLFNPDDIEEMFTIKEVKKDELKMTVREVAEILDVPIRTIHNNLTKIGIEKENGKTTYLSEQDVTELSLELKNAHNIDLASTRKVVQTDLERKLVVTQAIQILTEDIELLKGQIIKKEEQVKRLIHTGKLYTATEIAKELNMKSAQELNLCLQEEGIQYKVNDTWVLTSKYSDCDYESIKQLELESGKVVYDRKWTGTGRDFILDILG